MKHRRIVLARRPSGVPSRDDFEIEECSIPQLGPGEILVENCLIGLTPGDRLYMNRQLQLREVMRGHTLAIVVDANGNTEYHPGDFVVARAGWQEMAAVPASEVRPAPFRPRSLNLGLLGSPGLTAYFGLLEVGRLRVGETVVVSGSTGVVGSVVLQLARLHGCRTIAIASEPSTGKNAWLRNQVRPDALVDELALYDDLKRLCPDGIDLFFDNVGGSVLEELLRFLGAFGRRGARIVCCGMIADYNRPSGSRPGVRHLEVVINRSLELRGFLTSDFEARYGPALDALSDFVMQGKIRGREHVVDGLEQAPFAFCEYMNRRVSGKVLIKLKNVPELFAPSTP